MLSLEVIATLTNGLGAGPSHGGAREAASSAARGNQGGGEKRLQKYLRERDV